jgi:hypothetical protein
MLGRHLDERRALTLATVLMLLASPLAWNHYMLMLLVPLALAYPRLNFAWSVPLVLWLCPARSATLAEWLLMWLVIVLAAVLSWRRSGEPHLIANPGSQLLLQGA